ncbi:MAG TPA: YidC/Oxa1 family insertase periplasmic-domain containing protein [Opitutaceae bacterium]|nr:YidC/Oxa1 family insertase periplasmic-domain containing protein [Opitutaceae bacterium]
MDKKNTLIGVLLLLAAFASLYFGSRFSAPPPRAPEIGRPVGATGASSPPANPAGLPPPVMPSDATFAQVAKHNAGETLTLLANDFIEVRLTDFGGAIRDVALRKFRAELDNPAPYIFNRYAADPILAFTKDSFPGLGSTTRYELVSATPTEVVYRAVLDNRIEVTRRYALPPPGATSVDPYQIRHETTFRNLTGETLPLPRPALSLGTASLVSANDYGQYLSVAGYNGARAVFTDRGELEGAGVIGRMLGGDPNPKAYVEKTDSLIWAAVTDQFFASIYAGDKAGTGVITRRIDPSELPPFPGTQRPNAGLTGSERFELPPLAPGATATLAGALYVGPKEYPRLARFAHNEDLVMQYSRRIYSRIFLCGYVAPFMNTLMNWTHRWVYNWGLAIVLMTLIIKTVTLPFTLAASRSAKRMQRFQPEIQALKQKYKDNPQKLNQATLELFKQHKINPMGGCLPMLITMPLFIGFFTMLQGTAELRFQSFLWARDLSAPDTVARFFGFPLNVMPLLMGATMLFQMRLTPQPTVDNAQAKMMKFMPVIFTLFCYSFSCALALYSTVNGIFTIGQQLVINRMKDIATDAPATPGGGKSAPKNVTPAGKKPRK